MFQFPISIRFRLCFSTRSLKKIKQFFSIYFSYWLAHQTSVYCSFCSAFLYMIFHFFLSFIFSISWMWKVLRRNSMINKFSTLLSGKTPIIIPQMRNKLEILRCLMFSILLLLKKDPKGNFPPSSSFTSTSCSRNSALCSWRTCFSFTKKEVEKVVWKEDP
jgi:hypothetical protein